MARLAGVLAWAALAAGGAPQDLQPAERLRSMLEYLRHLDRAEALLEASRLDDALRTAEEALRAAPADSLWDKASPRGAAAHSVQARAHAARGDAEAAFRSLQRAVESGLANLDEARRDPRLKALASDDRFAKTLGAAPAPDRFSGRTVADSKFGQGLMSARKNNFPKPGELAPDFELDRADGPGTLRLSSFRGRSPVALVFGSHT